MSNIIRLCLTLLFVFALSGQTHAQDLSPWEEAEKAAKQLNEAFQKCNTANAKSVTFDDLFDPAIEPFQANPKYLNTCIRVDGIASWRHLHRDAFSAYRTQRSGISQAHTLVRQHVGLANHELMTKKNLRGQSLNGEVIGVLGNCGLTMSGYCHYFDGPYILAQSIAGEPIKTRTRYVGENAAKVLGNLKKISREDAEKLGIARAFENWIAAIALRNKSGFEEMARIADYALEYEDNREVAEDSTHPFHGIWEAYFDDKSLYRKLDDNWDLERRYFQRFAQVALPEDMEKPWYGQEADTLAACICIEDNCEGRWPISSADFYVGPGVPYICKLLYEHGNELKNSSYSIVIDNQDLSKLPFWKIRPPSTPLSATIIETNWPEAKAEN